MPALPCPLGADCNKGPDGGTWFTVDIPFQEAKALLDDHVKVAHRQGPQLQFAGHRQFLG